MDMDEVKPETARPAPESDPTQTVSEKPAEKPIEKAAEKAAEKPAEKAVEKPAEKPAPLADLVAEIAQAKVEAEQHARAAEREKALRKAEADRAERYRIFAVKLLQSRIEGLPAFVKDRVKIDDGADPEAVAARIEELLEVYKAAKAEQEAATAKEIAPPANSSRPVIYTLNDTIPPVRAGR